MPAASALSVVGSELSAVRQLEHSLTHTRDAEKSTSGWERLANGTWFRREYFRLNQAPSVVPTLPPPPQAAALVTGMHVLQNIFTGSFDVVRNIEWMRAKGIHRVLVLGRADIPANDMYRLRIVNVVEGQLDLYFDSIVSLIIEAVTENANVLLLDSDGRTYNPACLVAFLLCSGWTFDWAVERVEGIYHIAFNQYKLACLRNWNQILESRRSEIGADVQRQSTSMPQILQSPLPSTTREPIIVSSIPSYASAPIVYSAILPSATPIVLLETTPALPPRVAAPQDTLLITASPDVTPTTTDQWAPRSVDSATAIHNALRRLDRSRADTARREMITA